MVGKLGKGTSYSYMDIKGECEICKVNNRMLHKNYV